MEMDTALKCVSPGTTGCESSYVHCHARQHDQGTF